MAFQLRSGCRYLRRSLPLESPSLHAVDMIIECAALEEAWAFGMTNRESNHPSTMNHRTAWYLPHQDLGRNHFRDFSRYRVGTDIFSLLVLFAEILDFRVRDQYKDHLLVPALVGSRIGRLRSDFYVGFPSEH